MIKKRKVIKMNHENVNNSPAPSEDVDISAPSLEYLGNDKYTNPYAEDYQYFIQNQAEKFQKAPDESDQDFEEKLKKDRENYKEFLFNSTEYGRETKDTIEKNERLVEKLIDRGKKAYDANKIFDKIVEQQDQKLAGLRQDFEDSLSVASPEDEEALARWRQSQDELEASLHLEHSKPEPVSEPETKPDNSGEKDSNKDNLDENNSNEDITKKEVVEDEIIEAKDNETTPSPDKKTFKIPVETPYKMYEDEEERMRKEWESMQGLDEFNKNIGIRYNEAHEAEMRDAWEATQEGLDEIKKNAEPASSPEPAPAQAPTGEIEPTDDTESDHKTINLDKLEDRWKYSVAMGYKGRDKVINARVNEAKEQNLGPEAKKQLAEIRARREKLMNDVRSDMAEVISQSDWDKLIDQAVNSNHHEVKPQEGTQAPEIIEAKPQEDDQTPEIIEAKPQEDDQSQEIIEAKPQEDNSNKRKEYLGNINRYQRILGPEIFTLMTEINDRTDEEYREIFRNLNLDDDVFMILDRYAKEAEKNNLPEGRGFRKWLYAQQPNAEQG